MDTTEGKKLWVIQVEEYNFKYEVSCQIVYANEIISMTNIFSYSPFCGKNE